MSGAGSITVRVPLAIRRRPGRKTVVTPARDGGELDLPTPADPALVKALARAFRYQRLLDEGRYASISEMAAGERIERGYLGRILQLTLLAPDIVGAILDGRPPAARGLPALTEPLPLEWQRQRASLGTQPGALERTSDEVPSVCNVMNGWSSGPVRRKQRDTAISVGP